MRPTGIVDPPVSVRPATGQVDDLLGEVRKRAAAGERVLVTTLTKRLAEDLSAYIQEAGIRGRYLNARTRVAVRFGTTGPGRIEPASRDSQSS